MMRKPDISFSQVCSESRERGSVMTRLVRDHLACSNHHFQDHSEKGARDEQGATRTASRSVQCKQSRTSGHLMFLYLRVGKKQDPVKDEPSLGSELEERAHGEHVR
jgi:hypothetical protein